MKFCYWSVADSQGGHAAMAATLVDSARRAGVDEQFHIWTDQKIQDAVYHPCGTFNKDHYLFKLAFLRDEVAKLDYDAFVFLDADNFFVRHPGPNMVTDLLRENKWWVQLECQTNTPLATRGDWWGCPLQFFAPVVRSFGVNSKRIYNCNAGMFIVRREAIDEFVERTLTFYDYCRNELRLVNFTEEAPLAYVGHLVDNPERNTLAATHQIWASDWTAQYNNRLPDGNPWIFEDYLSGEKRSVNPAIVHAMRAKQALIKGIPK